MPKPRLFIGSSAENRDAAYAVQEALERDAEVTVWTQDVFDLTRTTLEALVDLLDEVDFGLFVLSPDDLTEMRGQAVNVVRDNVIFELGLFIGRLGRERNFVLSPRDVAMHLPSDLLGLTPGLYDPSREDGRLVAAVGPAANKVRRAMEKLGPVPRPPRLKVDHQAEQTQQELTAFPSGYFVPGPDWDQRRFERGLFMAVHAGKTTEEETIDAAFRASPMAADAEALATWDARRELTLMGAGKGGSLDNIRSLVRQHQHNARLRLVLGAALERYQDYTGAALVYREAAAIATEAVDLSSAIQKAIAAEQQAGHPGDPASLDRAVRDLLARDPQQEAALLPAVREIATALQLTEIALSVGEQAATSSPEDTGLRFDLAYKYSDAGRPQLALWHYQAIPPADRSGATWNNLGVVYGSLEMPGTAVEAFTAASDHGETIADANLSDKLRNAGFFEQAQARAEAAIAKGGYHENVVASLEALRSAKMEEREAGEAALKNGREELAFRVSVGAAALATTLEGLDGAWQTDECVLTLQQEPDGRIVGTGQFERTPDTNALADMFLPPGTSRRPKTVDVKAVVRRVGNAFEGTITNTVRGETLSILGAAMSERRLLGHVEVNGTAHVWELGGDLPAYRWNRIRTVSGEENRLTPPSTDTQDH